MIRGGVKKSGTFGWCPPQSGLPSCGQSTTFLWNFFFFLESPDAEKMIDKNNSFIVFLHVLKASASNGSKNKVVLFWPKVVVGTRRP